MNQFWLSENLAENKRMTAKNNIFIAQGRSSEEKKWNLTFELKKDYD